MKGGNHNASTVRVQIDGCGRICCFVWWIFIWVVNCSGWFPLTLTLSPEGRGDCTVRFKPPRPIGERDGVRGRLLITRPYHHHLIAFVLTHEAVALFQRQRGLLAFTNRRVTGAELSQSLPVRDG